MYIRCTINFIKLNSNKTRVITFNRKIYVFYYAYKLWDSSITRTDTLIDLQVQLDSELHFHAHVDYIFSQSVRMLGLSITITEFFSNLDGLLILYLTVVRPKLQYASTLWNSIKFTDVTKLERI
jgi:hypothetical protein